MFSRLFGGEDVLHESFIPNNGLKPPANSSFNFMTA